MEIRYVELKDKEEWYLLDRHLPDSGFEEKVRMTVALPWLSASG